MPEVFDGFFLIEVFWFKSVYRSKKCLEFIWITPGFFKGGKIIISLFNKKNQNRDYYSKLINWVPSNYF